MPVLPPLPRQLIDGLAKAPLVSTKTIHGDAASLVVRQRDSATTTFVVIPETYGDLHDSLQPGAIVGIVIASVIGFILLLLVIYTILGFGPVSSLVRTSDVTESKSYVSRSMLSSLRKSEKPKKKVPSTRGARVLSMRRERTTRTSKHRSERRGKSPVVVEPMRKTRERSPLTTISSSSGGRGPAPREDPLPSDYDEENEVVVIEETTPSSRRHSRRAGPSRGGEGRGRRSSSRRSSYSEYDDRRYRR
ncbi:uncharacterized protein TRIREDRAFT_103555 [Trichoderma reesei QM6a]|jgi:hypothetical protein|uniref:Predicted protein n=2 Tax=Hypocrea jecorina TaxID=51453 RepID=G0RAS5_HYPJQ|nr:uncharacterized protein TRIREDRAFT_103555 [Trichoderma reesei QM6a]EGR51650.1 predicted protein [Trichoderma reesei QM6a]ETR97775.1 hypothetical protein M419DRAFT_12356 [Trichoderma reesei RUT C-30]